MAMCFASHRIDNVDGRRLQFGPFSFVRFSAQDGSSFVPMG